MNSAQVIVRLCSGGGGTVTPQNIADGLVGDLIAKIGERADHSIVAPQTACSRGPYEQSVPRRLGRSVVGPALDGPVLCRICIEDAFTLLSLDQPVRLAQAIDQFVRDTPLAA
jgi:hypothetical protein